MTPVSKNNPLLHYHWGTGCQGWNLVSEEGLSVKLERMPPHSSEMSHWHERARQFFFILQGEAVMETGKGRVRLLAGEGIHIPPGEVHRILNEGNTDLEFILSSQPTTSQDRVNCA